MIPAIEKLPRLEIGFYPTPSGITTFQDALSTYKTSKGAVQFPLDKPIPYDLIADMVRFRVGEQSARAASRAKKRKSGR